MAQGAETTRTIRNTPASVSPRFNIGSVSSGGSWPGYCNPNREMAVNRRFHRCPHDSLHLYALHPYNQKQMADSEISPAPDPAQPTEAASPPVPRIFPMLSVWLRDLIISLAISAFIIVFLYQPVKVEGTSMMPSLDDQERIFVNKFVYRLEPIERGDIVVFRYPRDPSKSFIKRVIGLAG